MLVNYEELQEGAGQEAVRWLLSEWSSFFVGGGEISTSEKMQIRL